MMMLVMPTALAIQVTSTGYNVVTPSFGDNAYYSVVLDGEGEAAVIGTIGIKNFNKNNLEEIAIEIPGKSARLIAAYQQVTENYTTEYRNEYRNEYRKVEYTSEDLSESSTFTLKLNESVAEDETARILIYYKAGGYAEESNGLLDFVFETPKYAADTNNVRVAINVQEGYYLRGNQARVNYQSTFTSMNSGMLKMSGSAQAAEFSTVAQRVQSEPGFVKTAYALDPWESFQVQGTYADANWKLYTWDMIIAIIVLLAGSVGAYFGIKKVWGQAEKAAKKSSMMRMVITGFGVGGLITTLWTAILFISETLMENTLPLIGILAISLLIATVLLIVGTATWFGKKYGVYQAIGVVVSIFVWMTILSIIILLVMGILNSPAILFF